MKYRRLGRSGLMVSELTLGTMNFGGPTDEATALRMIDQALDAAVAGFLRSQLSRDSSMRSVPQLRFYFDTSVGRGRELEDLIQRAADADRELGLRDDQPDGED